MKKIKFILLVMIIIAASLYIAFEVLFRKAVPSYTGTLKIEGLSSTVEVRTDENGIPHIFADNEKDLFFAQGYITARERLFQMELTRLAGRGELSTLFGEAVLSKDRFLRTVGFHRLAAKGYEALTDEKRNIIDAYIAGINAFINSGESLPAEFAILGAKPGIWEGRDSVAAGLLMAFSLTRSLYVDLVMYRIGEYAGKETAELLAPYYPSFAPTLTGKRMSPAPDRRFIKFPSKELSKTELSDFLQGEMPASNWMIFSGKMTESGKALFAGSPDLKPTLPALFYMMHIKGGRYDVAGGALPGVPGIGPLGFNGHIAWSAVNGRGDELDYFVEKLNPANPDQYLTEKGYRDFEIIDEVIRVKDKKGFREEKLRIKVSRHGPLISEVMPMAPDNTAMKWAAFDNLCIDLEGLLLMNRARDFNEFRNALSRVKTINLGFGYADKKGNIGWQFTASAPIRKKGDGSFPVPGWTGDYDWKGYIPYERLPYDYNPAAGFVASFNNDPGNAGYHLTHYYLFQRSIRFENIMKERGNKKVTLKDIKEMQLDTVSAVAQLWTPLIINACSDDELAEYVKMLKGWGSEITIGSSAALLFNAFYSKMMKNTLADETGDKLWEEGLSQSYLLYIPDLVLTGIAGEPDHLLYNNITTAEKETRDDMIRKSMREAVALIKEKQGSNPKKWTWGRAHKMYFEHPLGGKLPFFNPAPVPTNGDHFTINSGFWELANPFKMDSGGVIRIMVDFADPESATIISPPGQSGHYKSPHYNDLAQLWADGGQVPLRFNSGEKISRLLLLEPR